jgi:uncharacterized membrane protein YvbJ
MSFCPNCGNQIPDNEKFCAGCGTQNPDFNTSTDSIPVSDEQLNPQTAQETNPPSDNKKKLGIIVGVVFVVLILLIIAPGRGYKSTAKKFAKALETNDAKAIVNLIPKSVVKKAIKENDLKNKKELIEELEDSMPDYSDMDLKLHIEEYSKCDESDFDDIKDMYERNDLKKPSKARVVTYSAEFEIGGEETDSELDLTLVKIGKNWYVDAFSTNLY